MIVCGFVQRFINPLNLTKVILDSFFLNILDSSNEYIYIYIFSVWHVERRASLLRGSDEMTIFIHVQQLGRLGFVFESQEIREEIGNE